MAALVKRLPCFLNRLCNTSGQMRFPVRRFSIDADGDLQHMRTTVTFLNQEQDQGIFVDTYSSIGFRLNSDILVVGVGERENLSRINPNVIKYLRLHKINMEILSTDQALATFNFLNSEKRYVAGAFVPPSYVHAFEDDDINKGIPDNIDPAVLPDKDFEGSEDDDLTPIMNEGRKRLQDLRNRSDEQENKGRYE